MPSPKTMLKRVSISRRTRQKGTSTLDILVSFTILMAVISISTPVIVRHGRLLHKQRDYRVALDELTNQLDRLSSLPASELLAEVQKLTPSPFVTERLPGAKLTGEIAAADPASRVILRIVWNEAGRDEAPLTLAAWVPNSPLPASTLTPAGEATAP